MRSVSSCRPASPSRRSRPRRYRSTIPFPPANPPSNLERHAKIRTPFTETRHGGGHEDHEVHEDHKGLCMSSVFVALVFFVAAAVGRQQPLRKLLQYVE